MYWSVSEVHTEQAEESISCETGVHGKAIGYPTPYEPNLTHEEQMNIINPTIRLMGLVILPLLPFQDRSNGTKDPFRSNSQSSSSSS